MATPDAIMELDVEERLFYALVNGNPEDCRGLLDIIEDINVKNGSGRTLLHTAVRLGKLEWVEALLLMGSDPGIVDLSRLSVVDVAEEMCIKCPEEESHKKILKFVSFVNERESRRRVNTDRRGVAPSTSRDAVREFRDSIQSPTLENVKMARQLSLLKEAVDELKGEQASRDILLEKLEVSVTSLEDKWGVLEDFINKTCKSYDELREDIKELKELREDIKELKELREDIKELKELREDIKELKELREDIKELKELREDIKELKELREDIKELKELREDIKELKESRLPRIQSVSPNSKLNCVLSLMRRTSILNVDLSKLRRMKNYYEKLFSMSYIISSILMFLQYHPEVEIMVDLDSTTISGMKDNFIGIDGTECIGSRTNSFFDVEKMKAYAGLMVGCAMEEVEAFVPLMNVLTRVAIFFAFKNDGRPYEINDCERQRQYRKILEEAEERCSTGRVYVDVIINRVLGRGTQRRKELMFITLVPEMICMYGMIEGTNKLCQQLPNLFKYYDEHIITTLSLESQGENVKSTSTTASPLDNQ